MTDETMAEPLRLRRSLNGAGVAALSEDLLDRRGRPLALDGGEVEHVGAQCFQLLVAACSTWGRDGLAFAIVNPSEAMRRDLALLGHPVELLAIEGDRA